MNDFTTLTYLLSFPGMIAMIVLMTLFMKRMFPVWLKGRGQMVAYFWAAIFCIVAGAFQGKFLTAAEILETCVIWTINSVIVWWAAMKAFEQTDKQSKPVTPVIIDVLNEDEDVLNSAVLHAVGLLQNYNRVELRKKSQE